MPRNISLGKVLDLFDFFVENNVHHRSIMRADDHGYGLFESFAG